MGDIHATEDAADLSLGKEFVGETCLSNAEVAVILAAEESKIKAEGRELNRAFEKTYQYVKRFSGVKELASSRAALDQLREDLSQKQIERFDQEQGVARMEKLEEFEVAALCNIEPNDAEEAFTLIPSLAARFREDEIEEFLEIISNSASRA